MESINKTFTYHVEVVKTTAAPLVTKFNFKGAAIAMLTERHYLYFRVYWLLVAKWYSLSILRTWFRRDWDLALPANADINSQH